MAFGLPADAFAPPAGKPEDDDFIAWPEHEPPVLVYCACIRQLRVADGKVLGLDLNVALAVMHIYDVADRRQCLEDLRIMEERTAEVLNSKGAQG